MSVSARCTIGGLIGAAAASIAGCAINASPDFDSPTPQDRYLAIREAGATKDASATPDLIRQLATDDPLVRVAAIDALESITGQTLGYDPHAREIERRQAIDRWMEWLDANQDHPEDADS